MGVTYYVHEGRCPTCNGEGVVEVLSLCCGPLSPSRRECGCDGYTLDYRELCACARPVRAWNRRTA